MSTDLPLSTTAPISPLKKFDAPVWHRHLAGENTGFKPVPHILQQAVMPGRATEPQSCRATHATKACTGRFNHAGRALGRLSLVLLLSLSGCRTLHHDQNKQDAQQRWSQVRARFKYQLARQQYEGGMFVDAVMTATEAIALDPTEVDAYVVLARSNLELGKTASAIEALDAAKRAGLEGPALSYTRGVILEQRGDVEAALAHYIDARTGDPSTVDYLIAEIECLVALERMAEAQGVLEESGPAYDDRASVATLAAHVAVRSGNLPQAIAHYRLARAEAGESRTIARELGLLYARSEQCAQAVEVLRPLIDDRTAPQEEGILRRTLASCYLRLGAHQAARDVIVPHLDRHPDDALGQVLLAKAALASNDLMGATRAVELAHQAAPSRTEVWFVRAVVHWRRGNFDAAADALYDVLANDPNDVEAMCLLGEVLKATRRSDGAKAYFERALALDPECHWAEAALLQSPRAHDPDPVVVEESLTVAQ